MAKHVTLHWTQQGRAWQASARDHTVIGDSTVESGGENRGMTPVELLICALGLCTGLDLSYYAERHPGIDVSQVALEITWEDAPEKPSRVGAIHMKATLPAGLTDAQRAVMTRILNGCRVHNTLEHGVMVNVTVEEGGKL